MREGSDFPREQFVFDLPTAKAFNEARQVMLQRVMPSFKEKLGLRTAIDVGCGVGYFSSFLRQMQFQVIGLDGRPENIEEARKRFPEIDFRIADIEDSRVLDLGKSDFVLCLGLLYHLENPFRAIRNLHGLTGKILFIESMCIPENDPVLYLLDEGSGEDQSLNFVAFYPTEACLAKMLYRSGFPFVYRLKSLPSHVDFQSRMLRTRARTMVIASKAVLEFDFLMPLHEKTIFASGTRNPWLTPLARVLRPVGRIWHFVRKPWAEKRATLRRFGLS